MSLKPSSLLYYGRIEHSTYEHAPVVCPSRVVLLSACRTHVTARDREMTESAGVRVGKFPVTVHGGMTERLEIQQLRVLDFV